MIVWPTWAARDLWRWGMLAIGFVMIAHGLLSKQMRIRDHGSWRGFLFGKIAEKRWQVVYMRALFVAIGVACIVSALSSNFITQP